MNLEGKVAIVTGAAQGIGKAIADKLSLAGCNIVIADISEDLLDKACDEISKKGVNVLGVKVDVSSFTSVEELVKKTLDKFKKIDILINNAGITRDNLLLRMSEEDWDRVLNINLKGVFNCIKTVSRQMLKQRSGIIVNVASIIGMIGNPGQANYSASKAGVIALTKTCAKELASRNIRVNAIAPGFIKTHMTDVLPDNVKEELKSRIPFNRLGLPEDVANLVLFLVSEDSNYITGQVVRIDGGMVM